MKVVILAGGFGTRLSEKTDLIPKPMVEIGGYPILWHIMNIYSSHGFKEFVVTLGYKGDYIKDFFLNYFHRSSNLSLGLKAGDIKVHEGERKDWTVHLLDTGLNTQTGGRIKKAAEFIGNEPFMLTYGDGVSNVDIGELVRFHKEKGKKATVTAVRPPARFGNMAFEGDSVAHFEEKPQLGEGWINGGFFVIEPEVVELINGEDTVWERQPLEGLASQGELSAYKHGGYWQCMDTLRDVNTLNKLWQHEEAPRDCHPLW